MTPRRRRYGRKSGDRNRTSANPQRLMRLPGTASGRAVIKRAVGRVRRTSYFGRAVLTIAGAAALAQVLTVLAAPVLTRLYVPQDFGVYALFTSCLSIAGIVATGTYERALALPARLRTAVHLLLGTLALATIVVAILGAMLPLFAGGFARLIGEASLQNYLWLLPVALWFVAIATTLEQLCIRQRDYRTVAETTVTRSFATTSVQLGLGVWLASPYGLIIASIVGTLFAGIRLAHATFGHIREVLLAPKWTEVKAALYEYKRFPLLETWSSLLFVAASSAVPILLTATYGLAVAGLYELSARIVQRPLTLIGTSIQQVYWGEAAKRLRDDPPALMRLFRRLVVRLSLMALVPTLALAIFAPSLVGFVFGSEWHEAGRLIQVMAPLLLARLTIPPLTSLALLGRQDLMLALNAVRLVLTVATLLGGFYAGLNAVQTVALYAAAATLINLARLVLWIRALRLLVRDNAAVTVSAPGP